LSKKELNLIRLKILISGIQKERFIQLEYACRIEKPDSIHGMLTLHPDLEKFTINSGKRYSTHELANY
jgi:hypothetical protein